MLQKMLSQKGWRGGKGGRGEGGREKGKKDTQRERELLFLSITHKLFNSFTNTNIFSKSLTSFI